MMHYIDVILPIPLKKLFTYSITEAESAFLQKGMRVAVPFGKTKIYTALVFCIHTRKPLTYDAKPIHQILDESPLVTFQQLKHWEWVANYYMATLGEVMRAALPSAFLLESETHIKKTNEKIDIKTLTDDEYLVYEALQKQSFLKIDEIAAIIDKKNALPLIKELIDKDAVSVYEAVYEKYQPKMVRYIRFNTLLQGEADFKALLEDLSRAPKQRQAVMSVFALQAETKKPIKVSQLKKRSGISASIIKTLIDKNILEDYYLQSDRVQFKGETLNELPNLNTYQEQALKQIKTAFKTRTVCLLHGVTSSGKTEIYTRLIQQKIANAQQVLYLLPEIALTTQLVTRLQMYFGDAVAVYHSRYSNNERVEVWQQVLKESPKAKLIIGARSALFLPFQNLGLIIVDEEHESSYKQFNPAPRYHTRDAAIVLAKQFKVNVLLGSATPSIESYYNAQQGKYGLVVLKHRYNNVIAPEIQLINLQDKYKRKQMKGHFSDTLLNHISEALNEKQQVILFQNRRGYSPIVECKTCGISPQCINCDVSLTFHQHKQQLRCHYCGYHEVMLQQCQACGSSELDTKGFGTEQIESEVKTFFPQAHVKRMDLDTTRGKYSFQKLISSFEAQEIDVLVGTQMVTKGLDFRNVKLVGVLNADSMLNFPDFRALERSFQLMLQVAGRAGRTEQQGKVFIQAFNPYHSILTQVSSRNYDAMFKEQMEDRCNFKYPPVYRLIKLTVKHKNIDLVNAASDWLGQSLKQTFKTNVLGPEFPPISRIRNQYHKNILIKIPPKQSLNRTKKAIEKIINSFESIAQYKAVRLLADVDTY